VAVFDTLLDARLETLLDVVNVRELGCIAMHEVNGTSNGTATANAAFINAYLDGGWRTQRRALYFPAGGWLINDTIVLPDIAGFALIGHGGSSLASAESQYEDGVSAQGGPSSRLVWSPTGSTTYDGPMLSVRGAGPLITGLNFQGQWHATSDITLRSDYPEPAGADLRCRVGIEVQGNQNFQGTGKAVFPTHLNVSLCTTALKCIDEPSEDHADQLLLRRFSAGYCDTGLWIDNHQSVGSRVEYFDGSRCGTLVRIDQGGKFWCGFMSMETDTNIGILTTGNDQSEVTGQITVDYLNIDGTAPANCKAIYANTATGGVGCDFRVGYLEIPSTRSSGVLVDLKSHYGDLNIMGGRGFYNGWLKVTGNTDEFFTCVRQHNTTYRHGARPIAGSGSPPVPNLLSTDAVTYVLLDIRGCREAHNNTGSTNGGLMFDDYSELRNRATTEDLWS
jgi:hypothetical protein